MEKLKTVSYRVIENYEISSLVGAGVGLRRKPLFHFREMRKFAKIFAFAKVLTKNFVFAKVFAKIFVFAKVFTKIFVFEKKFYFRDGFREKFPFS
jgi:hypothetical protein